MGAFSVCTKVTCKSALYSLLCFRICSNVKMWSEQDRYGRKPFFLDVHMLADCHSIINTLLKIVLQEIVGSDASPVIAV